MMKPKTSKSNKAPTYDQLEDQTATLSDELELSARWRRPSILMVTYRSRLVLLDAQHSLQRRLRRLNQAVQHVAISPENFDVPLLLAQHPDPAKTTFFITGLKDGGGTMDLNAYRAFNMRRELLVDHKIRAVFWLNQDEAAALPLNAPDFWAFRHRMLELPEESQSQRIQKLVENLDWPYWDPYQLDREIPAGINLRNELLAEIPEWDNAPGMRARLMYSLAALYWCQGKAPACKKLLEQGLALASDTSQKLMQARFWVGLGLLEDRQDLPGPAIAALQNALALNPVSSEAWLAMARVYLHQGHKQDAMHALHKSIDLDPKSTGPWNLMGDIHRDSGRMGDAIQAYQHSLSLNAKDARIWTELGNAYRSQNQPALALAPIKKAQKLQVDNLAAAWINLGDLYCELGYVNRAIRAFYKAARKNPLNSLPWKKLGDLYSQNQRPKSAQKAYKTALNLAPHDKSLAYSLKTEMPELK